MTGSSHNGVHTTDLLAPALTTCAGCAMAVAFRQLLAEVGPRSIVVIPPGCAYIFTGLGDRTPLQIPGFMGNLGATAAFLSGIEAGLEMVKKGDINIIGFAGDGATVDIGLQALSGALERGHHFLYVCYDNEGYMNTGAQGSGSTPLGGWTSTTPVGKDSPRKDIARIAIAHGAPYVATASVAYPAEFRESVRRGLEADGPAFIHLQTPCPTGWRFPPERTLEIARLAVQTGVFPLYEVVHGRRRLIRPKGELRPLRDYISAQGRFSHLTSEQMTTIHTRMKQSIEKTMDRLAEGSDDLS
jgi:pyruvate ferredoxin oxidoreductase beta subunit